MSSQAAKLKKLMKTTIRDMARNQAQFTRTPGRDFTRKRKLDFASVVSILLSMSGGSTTNSLMDYFKFDPNTASTSAFVQQRAKLKPEAMEYLFQRFVQGSPVKKTFRGYRLLAVDGSDLRIFADPNDPESYYPGANGQQPYSLLHLNALFDLENQIYTDAFIHKSRGLNEHKALIEMLDRATIQHAVLLADRGYEGYNNLAHLKEKGWSYLFRIKDGANGIASGLALPETAEFDLSVELHLTRRQTKDVKALCLADPNRYRWLPSHVTFDYLPIANRKHDPLSFYELSFRIVRFRLSEDSFETVVTNLPANTFPPAELKLLYARRWGIETSFRQLKYTLGLVHFHAKKVEHIYQEVFAKLTMYNFSELITSHVVIQKRNTKYSYSVNFSAAVHICRNFFLGYVSPPELEALLSRLLLPIRPGRSNSRKPVQRQPFSFLYRVA
ncbi:MAG: IS4 family transposase [Lachnospiraceae bacterium]|nr:IS4 family transposase [Lachnospiraceae bacterium]